MSLPSLTLKSFLSPRSIVLAFPPSKVLPHPSHRDRNGAQLIQPLISAGGPADFAAYIIGFDSKAIIMAKVLTRTDFARVNLDFGTGITNFFPF